MARLIHEVKAIAVTHNELKTIARALDYTANNSAKAELINKCKAILRDMDAAMLYGVPPVIAGGNFEQSDIQMINKVDW